MNDEIEHTDNEEKGLSKFTEFISEPLSKYGLPPWLVYTLAIIGFIYLLNPTMGIVELIPDIFPFIGNFDEGIAVLLILAGVVEALEGKKYRQSQEEGEQDVDQQRTEDTILKE